MKWINRHTYTIPKAFPEGNAHKRTLFQNHPNLFLRDLDGENFIDIQLYMF